MRIKKFSSRTVPEALAAVRAEFGDDAVILSTNRSEADPTRFDVMAALDVPTRGPRPATFPRVEREGAPLVPAGASGRRRSAGPSPREREAGSTIAVRSDEPALPPRPRAPIAAGLPLEEVIVEDAAPPRDRVQLLDEIRGLRGRLETVAGLLLGNTPENLPEPYRRMHLRLLETGLDARVATAVVRRAARTDVPLERAIHHILSAAVRVGGPIGRGLGQQVIALVGPTGVGKTTTIAKIASHLVLEEKRKVSLISADGFRVGGAEQLEFYAGILEAPFHVAHDRDALAAAISASGEAEVILVDTTGRGSGDGAGVDEIGALLEVDARLARWLVVSAVASTIDNLAALRTFARLHPSGAVVTKADETTTHGAVATVLIRSTLALRYVTDGQIVPDDLIGATRDSFPDLLLSGHGR